VLPVDSTAPAAGTDGCCSAPTPETIDESQCCCRSCGDDSCEPPTCTCTARSVHPILGAAWFIERPPARSAVVVSNGDLAESRSIRPMVPPPNVV
jgi:hypothetical protein